MSHYHCTVTASNVVPSVSVCYLTLYGQIKTAEQRTIIQHHGDWYTGR